MEAVEDVQRFGAVLADKLQVRFPHVRTDEADVGNDLLAHSAEESLEGLDCPLFAYPQQPREANIDLIDQRQIFVPLGVLDLIDADGVDLAERTVCETPDNRILDGIEDLVSRSAERLGSLLPGEAARPTG